MAKLSGKKMLVLVGGVVIGATKSFTLTINSQTIDTTTKDDDAWGSSLYGSKDWNVSIDGLYDPDDPMNAEELFDAIANDTRLLLEMADLDGKGGGLVFKGYANASGLVIGASYNDAVTFSGTLQGDGAIQKGTVATS